MDLTIFQQPAAIYPLSPNASLAAPFCAAEIGVITRVPPSTLYYAALELGVPSWNTDLRLAAVQFYRRRIHYLAGHPRHPRVGAQASAIALAGQDSGGDRPNYRMSSRQALLHSASWPPVASFATHLASSGLCGPG